MVAQAEHRGQGVPAVKAIGRSDAPCVILMDVNLPVIDGIKATRRVSALALAPAVQVLALSTHDDPTFVAAMMAGGACGYMLKDDLLDELVNAIHEVAAGRRVFSSALAAIPSSSVGRRDAADEPEPSQKAPASVLRRILEGPLASPACVAKKPLPTH